jgi:hypothetical protein
MPNIKHKNLIRRHSPGGAIGRHLPLSKEIGMQARLLDSKNRSEPGNSSSALIGCIAGIAPIPKISLENFFLIF